MHDAFRIQEAFEAGMRAFHFGHPLEVPMEFTDLEMAVKSFRMGWRWAQDCAPHYV